VVPFETYQSISGVMRSWLVIFLTHYLMPKTPQSIRSEINLNTVKCVYSYDHTIPRDAYGNLLVCVHCTFPPAFGARSPKVHSMVLPVGDWSAVGSFLVEMGDKIMRGD